MVKIRCKLNYHELRTTKIKVFAIGVRDGVFGNNPPFITPPTTIAALQLLIDDYSAKYDAFLLHTASLSEVDDARDLLMEGLDLIRPYVDTVANGNATIVSLAGFVPTKGSTTNVIIPVQPFGVTLVRGIQGELIAECAVITDADSYGAVLASQPLPPWFTINGFGQVVIEQGSTPTPVPPLPPSAPSAGSIGGILDLTKTRKKTFKDLEVGVTYYVYFWAVNAAGVSPLSNAVSKKVIEL